MINDNMKSHKKIIYFAVQISSHIYIICYNIEILIEINNY